MRRTVILLGAAAAMWGAIALADRTVTYSSSTVDVFAAQIRRMADGGCQVSACGRVKQPDGGAGYERCTDSEELTGTAQTRCLTFLNSAETLWKTREDL